MVKGMTAGLQEGRVLRVRTPALRVVTDTRKAIAGLGPVAAQIIAGLPQSKGGLG